MSVNPTRTIFNRGVVGGGQPFLSRRPRDDDFDSADDREMGNSLGILQRPHVQRAPSVHGGRAQLLSSGDKKS